MSVRMDILDGRQSMINVTFHVGSSCSIDETSILRFFAELPLLILYNRAYLTFERDIISVKWRFDCPRFVLEDRRIRFFQFEQYFSVFNVLRTDRRRMISNFRDDARRY